MRRGWSLPVRQVTGRRLEWGTAPPGGAAAAGRSWSRGEGRRGLKRRVDEERRREKFVAIEPSGPLGFQVVTAHRSGPNFCPP
jgi:hypothetical protein